MNPETLELARRFAGRFDGSTGTRRVILEQVDRLAHWVNTPHDTLPQTVIEAMQNLDVFARAEKALAEEDKWHTAIAVVSSPKDTADYRGDVKEEQT